MSAFLLKLAKRSAGIMPIARPRTVPAMPSVPGDVGTRPTASDIARVDGPIAAIGVDRTGLASNSGTRLRPASDPIAAGPPPERRARLGEPPRASRAPERIAPSDPATRSSAAPPDPIPRPGRVAVEPEAVLTPPPHASSSRPGSTGRQMVSPRPDPEPVAIQRTIRIAALDPTPVRDPDTIAPRPDSLDRRSSPAVPRLVVDQAGDPIPRPRASEEIPPLHGASLPLAPAEASGIRPAPRPPARRLPTVESATGRRIQVRIGAIEIHGEEARPVAPAAASPAVLPPTAPPIVGEGFAAFARLRTYAPWDR
jgi:hypothetical protein